MVAARAPPRTHFTHLPPLLYASLLPHYHHHCPCAPPLLWFRLFYDFAFIHEVLLWRLTPQLPCTFTLQLRRFCVYCALLLWFTPTPPLRQTPTHTGRWNVWFGSGFGLITMVIITTCDVPFGYRFAMPWWWGMWRWFGAVVYEPVDALPHLVPLLPSHLYLITLPCCGTAF